MSRLDVSETYDRGMSSRYEIARRDSGQWHLYRDGNLVDVEHDPERSPLAVWLCIFTDRG
jgi:hypothetical protein